MEITEIEKAFLKIDSLLSDSKLIHQPDLIDHWHAYQSGMLNDWNILVSTFRAITEMWSETGWLLTIRELCSDESLLDIVITRSRLLWARAEGELRV